MQLWLLFLVLFASGFVQGFLGFGFAITALTVLPYYIDIYQSNVMITFSVIVPVGIFSYQFRKYLNVRILLTTLVGSLIGLPVGLYSLTNLDAPWIVRLTGLAILLVALDGLIKFRKTRPATRARETFWGVTAGLFSGYLAGAVSIAGPPVVAYGTRQDWNHSQFKAYIFTLSVIVSLSRAVGMLVTDLAETETIIHAIYSIPFIILGIFVGEILSKKVHIKLIQKITFLLLIVIAISMLDYENGDSPSDEQKETTTSGILYDTKEAQFPSSS